MKACGATVQFLDIPITIKRVTSRVSFLVLYDGSTPCYFLKSQPVYLGNAREKTNKMQWKAPGNNEERSLFGSSMRYKRGKKGVNYYSKENQSSIDPNANSAPAGCLSPLLLQSRSHSILERRRH
jgi:hypothetical protein